MVLIRMGFLEILWKITEPGFRKMGGYPGTRWRSEASMSMLGTEGMSLSVSVECRVCGAHLNRFSRDILEQ